MYYLQQNIPFDELQFATWLVASRSFAIKISVDDPLVREGAVSTQEKSIRVLLPYLDMINHSSDNANSELHLIDPEKDDGEDFSMFNIQQTSHSHFLLHQ